MREILESRTVSTKLFDLGGKRRLLRTGIGQPLHYLKNGTLEDIDLEPIVDRGAYLIDKAPFALRVSPDVPSYRYTSVRGEVEVTLRGVNATAVKDATAYRWNVGIDTEYVIQPLPLGCSTKLILNSARASRTRASRTWSWEVLGDASLLKPIVGRDANGRLCEIETDLVGNVLTATWTGRVTSKGILRATPNAPWSDKPEYPVTIDPTVNETIGTGADDVASATGTIGTGFFSTASNLGAGFYSGGYGPTYNAGLRFQTVAVPQGETINSSTLTLFSAAVIGAPSLRVYADDVDNAPGWSTSSLPKDITKTTAFAAWAPTATGTAVINVASVVLEIISRGGWASGNDIRFAVLNQSASHPNVVLFQALENSGTAQAVLDIDYGTVTANVPGAMHSYRMRRVS